MMDRKTKYALVLSVAMVAMPLFAADPADNGNTPVPAIGQRTPPVRPTDPAAPGPGDNINTASGIEAFNNARTGEVSAEVRLTNSQLDFKSWSKFKSETIYTRDDKNLGSISDALISRNSGRI